MDPTVYSSHPPGVPAGLSDSEALRLNAKFLRNGIVMLVLVAGTVALLYTWVQSSAPGAQSVGYSSFYNDVKAGAVEKVVQDGETLEVTKSGNTTYTVVVPNNITGDVYADMQKAAAEGRSPRRRTRRRRPRTRRGSACCSAASCPCS